MCSWIWSGKFRCWCESIEQTSLDREEDAEDDVWSYVEEQVQIQWKSCWRKHLKWFGHFLRRGEDTEVGRHLAIEEAGS